MADAASFGDRGWGSSRSHTPEKSRREKLACPHPAGLSGSPESLRMPQHRPPGAPGPTAACGLRVLQRWQAGAAGDRWLTSEPPYLPVQRQQQHLRGLQFPQGIILHTTYFPSPRVETQRFMTKIPAFRITPQLVLLTQVPTISAPKVAHHGALGSLLSLLAPPHRSHPSRAELSSYRGTSA